jgi:hypothetical protein
MKLSTLKALLAGGRLRLFFDVQRLLTPTYRLAFLSAAATEGLLPTCAEAPSPRSNSSPSSPPIQPCAMGSSPGSRSGSAWASSRSTSAATACGGGWRGGSRKRSTTRDGGAR